MKNKRIVVKLGTSVLTSGSRQLHRPTIIEIARQCAKLRVAGHDVLICSSGAVAAGKEKLRFPDLPATVTNKQMLASVGQSQLMLIWQQAFAFYDVDVGQILLTREDVQNRNRFLYARDTLNTLLEHGIIPIVNENDAVATEEIKVGDNDNLSALVATLIGADLLLLLTDQDGLYTADPRSKPDAKLIPVVEEINDSVRQVAGGSVTGLGIGGMSTKLEAAVIGTNAGTDVIIAAGTEPDVIERLVSGEAIGTRFPAKTTPLQGRKKWIISGAKPAGKLTIDDGAVMALSKKLTSLLPAGVVSVTGDFRRGDAVSIVTKEGKEIGRGIGRYSSHDLSQIAGKQSTQINAILGYTYGSVVIHRDDLILL